MAKKGIYRKTNKFDEKVIQYLFLMLLGSVNSLEEWKKSYVFTFFVVSWNSSDILIKPFKNKIYIVNNAENKK